MMSSFLYVISNHWNSHTDSCVYSFSAVRFKECHWFKLLASKIGPKTKSYAIF